MGRPHGYVRYKLGPTADGDPAHGCRCYVCAFAHAQYRARVAEAQRAGLWHPWCNPSRVRAHIRALNAVGLGDRTIAALADCDRSWVRFVRAGYRRTDRPLGRVSSRIADRVLAIDPDPMANAPDHALIDGTETLDRISDLLGAGWSKARICAALGHDGRALQIRPGRVTVRNARAVLALWLHAGFREPRPSGLIDEVVVYRLTHGEPVQGATRAERHEAVQVLTARGMSAEQIAERLDVTSRTVVRDRHDLEAVSALT